MRKNKRAKNPSWSTSVLEPRLMLAGDGFAQVAQHVSVDSPAPVCLDNGIEAQAQVTPAELVFVDSNVDDFETIAAGISASAELILLDVNKPVLQQITDTLDQRKSVRGIHIISHGNQGQLEFDSGNVDSSSLETHRSLLAQWSNSLTRDADILLYGCNVAEGDLGQQFIRRMALLTGADVAASINITGAAKFGADWDLESSVGTIDTAIVLSKHAQANFRDTLNSTIQIFAAGTTNEETIELFIAGESVATYGNLGTGAFNGQFQSRTFNAVDTVTANDVRIAFTNDLFDVVNGIDRNVAIDAIVIDGVRFETEDASVFSTGTWLPTDGVADGFGRGEFLHSDGYFQYAGGGSPGSTTPITINARGAEGTESFALQIDGQTVQTWDNINTSFSSFNYTAAGLVSADQIRVVFLNDEFDLANGIDSNLIVDDIVVGGVQYETEASDVFSTGTWLNGAVQPGLGRGDTLHVNGYFQYSSGGGTGSTVTVRASGDEGGEQFRLLIDGTNVGTFTASTNFQTFAYNATDNVTADQVRVELFDSQYNPAAGIDENLNVDYITVDGNRFETEASTTLSTGTWNSSNGITTGFGRGETLHADGYFQYLATGGGSAGFVGLGDTQVTVNEDDGVVQLEIIRFDGSSGPATAFFQTLGVEATDGVDFVGQQNGRVDFVDGQTSALATIQLLDDGLIEQTESFTVSLFRVEGAELNVPRTAIVTIVDNETNRDLIGHWRLNETAIGQTVVDSSVSGNNGSHRNIVSPSGPSTDRPDTDTANPRGVDFDGVDDFIEIGSDPSLRLTGGTFTQAVWIRPEVTDNAFHGVLGYQPSTGTVNRYPGIWVVGRDRIHAGFGDGTNWNNFDTGSVLTVGQWNHVATTFDGTSYKAYVNGAEVFSTDAFAGRSPALTDQFHIGRVDNFFQGGIDDVRIYDRALSASEVGVLIDGATLPSGPLQNGEFIRNDIASGFDTPVEVELLTDGRILVAEQDGVVRIVNANGTVASNPLLDIRDIVNSGTKDRGMIGFAVHPDFDNNPYIYAAFTYDPPETANLSGLAGRDGNGARVARISRFTVNSAGTFADPNSEVVLVGGNSTFANIGDPSIRPGLNDPHSCLTSAGDPIGDCIPADETSHTIGELEFGPDGNLYIASGDGGSFGRVDPINLRALDTDSLAGKILRIDPITGQGLTDNPFYDGNASSNRSKVFVYGLRNPFRFAFNDDPTNPTIYIGDVGWGQWEEINIGTGGENFGWPAFEGGNGVSLQTGGYRNLQQVIDFYATNPDVTPAAWARVHSDGARAIVMGDIVSSSYQSIYDGTLIFTDIGDQILRTARLNNQGEVVSVEIVSQNLGFIVDLETGPDGFMYYVDITGTVGRLGFA